MNSLKPKIKEKIRKIFPDNPTEPEEMILGLCDEYLWEDGGEMLSERICAALLKCSNGRIDNLLEAINLANTDWRDLLVSAGFAEDISAHKNWLND